MKGTLKYFIIGIGIVAIGFSTYIILEKMEKSIFEKNILGKKAVSDRIFIKL